MLDIGKLYELYRLKGLNDRAANYRAKTEKKLAIYGVTGLYNEIDKRYSNSSKTSNN